MMEHFISRPAAQITVRLGEHGPPGTCPLLWARSEQSWEQFDDTAPKWQRITLDQAQDSRTASMHQPIITHHTGLREKKLPMSGQPGESTHSLQDSFLIPSGTDRAEEPLESNTPVIHSTLSCLPRGQSRQSELQGSSRELSMDHCCNTARHSWESGWQHCPKHCHCVWGPSGPSVFTSKASSSHTKFMASCSYLHPSSSPPFSKFGTSLIITCKCWWVLRSCQCRRHPHCLNDSSCHPGQGPTGYSGYSHLPSPRVHQCSEIIHQGSAPSGNCCQPPPCCLASSPHPSLPWSVVISMAF